MKYLKHILLLIALNCSLASSAANLPQMLSTALDSLDAAIDRYPELYNQRHLQIDSLVIATIKPGHEPDAQDFLAIARAYDGFNVDSAAHYYYAAFQLLTPDTQPYYSTKIDLALQYAKMCRFSDANFLLNTINSTSLSRENRLKYYGVASRICIDDLNFSKATFNRSALINRAIQLLDSLNDCLAENSMARWLVESRKSAIRGDIIRAMGELNEAIESFDPDSPTYAMLAAMLADCYANRPDKLYERAYYLALSSRADLLNVNCDVASLANLGETLMNLGDKDRAFRYLELSSRIMRDSGSLMFLAATSPRFIEVAGKVHEADLGTTRAGIVVIVTLTLIIILLAAVIFNSKIRSAREAHTARQLRDSVANRELYITQLLKLCSSYVDGFEEFMRFVTRKLKANQSADLLSTIESGRMLTEFSEKFFVVYDDAIFKIFPNFLEDVNSLLLEDKQVELPVTGRLTPELRILAFMRLGVTDSNRISKFLGLSLNTVYTYRNRMKNRAKNRESFESDVLKIG
ncbi:MAG: DUF6377 domain-containing protein [Muribaculaceae bacterium]